MFAIVRAETQVKLLRNVPFFDNRIVLNNRLSERSNELSKSGHMFVDLDCN